MPAKRGPPRTPLKILKTTESWRASAREKDSPEPEFRAGEPIRPKGLKGQARKAWDRYAKLLAEKGVITEADHFVLWRFCELYGIWDEWLKMKPKPPGPTVNPETGALEDPTPADIKFYLEAYGYWKKGVTDLSAAVYRLESVMGLTPADRTRVQVLNDGAESGKKARNLFAS